MGKHLSFEEKHNASNELAENKEKIKELRAEIQAIKYRNNKLLNYLQNKNKSKHKGCFGENGVVYINFGKRFSELTIEEKRKYDAIMKKKYKAKKF